MGLRASLVAKILVLMPGYRDENHTMHFRDKTDTTSIYVDSAV